MFYFGGTSKKRISEVHKLLQELAYKTIETSTVDFGIAKYGGLRTAIEQKQLFDKKYSKCDGTIKKSYHQSGLAIDFVPYINGTYTWADKKAFLAIAQAVFSTWSVLPDKMGFFLHWGGFWGAKDLNFNELLDLDKELGWDLPHFELRTVEQTRGVYPISWL